MFFILWNAWNFHKSQFLGFSLFIYPDTDMQQGKILKKILWFSITYFVVIISASVTYCQCVPWDLFAVLYFFFLFYLVASSFSRRFFLKIGFNPLSFLILSFFLKILVVTGVAFLLVRMFQLEQIVVIFLYVVGYIVACIFDFIILDTTTKTEKKYESQSQ